MALEVTSLTREFRFTKNGKTVTLPDPNREFTAQEVIQFYSNQHPELTTCTVDGPKIENDKQVYEFKTTIGTKG